MNRKLFIASALAAAPLLWPLGASAGLLAEFSLDGGATFTTICTAASGGSCSGSTTTPNGVVLSIESATSDSPGTPTLADLLSSAVSITNSTAVTETVEIRIGDTGFMQPTAPPVDTLESAIGATVVIPGALNSLSYISCVDQGDGQNVCPGTTSTPAVTPSITAIGSSNDSDSVGIATLTGPYSVTEQLTLTLTAGSNINYSASSRLTSVAEPASLTLLGLALLALGALGRRRNAT